MSSIFPERRASKLCLLAQFQNPSIFTRFLKGGILGEMKSDFLIFSLGSNDSLAQKISKGLQMPLGRVNCKVFSDGEQYVQFGGNVIPPVISGNSWRGPRRVNSQRPGNVVGIKPAGQDEKGYG